MSTETETTEKISTEDLMLLAEVMGWKQISHLGERVPREGTFYVVEEPLSELASKAMVAYPERGGFCAWDPTRDTPEGLWQAKRLRRAWCAQVSGRWAEVEELEAARYFCHLYHPDGLVNYGEAPTESLAIVRAVLAAAKGAAKE